MQENSRINFISGGLKQCCNSETACEKWVLNRPMQAEYTEGLMDLFGSSRSIMNPRKCLRPSKIIKSEEMVKRVQGIITETFVNPFQADLPKDNLYNIVSGRPVDSKIHLDLCTIRQEGKVKLKEFTSRLSGNHLCLYKSRSSSSRSESSSLSTLAASTLSRTKSCSMSSG